MSKVAQNTRRNRLESKEQAIIDAADAVFRGEGYRGATMAEIARRSGVADGTLYLYFRNKEALGRAVIAHFYAQLTAQARNNVDELSTAEERLRFLARHHINNIMDGARIMEMLPLFNFTFDSYDGSELFLLNKAYTSVFDRVAKDGIAAGDLRADISLQVMRDMFYGTLEYSARTILVKGRPKHITGVVDDIMRLLLPAGSPTAPDIPQRMEHIAERLEQVTTKLQRAAQK